MSQPSLVDLVDTFIGTEATKLPEPQGIAKPWTWFKAEVGNTHPGPCRPFAMVSACPYSGAYPSGYGLYRCCCSGQPERAFEDFTATGFTHFQHSGTGMIGTYYNFLRVIPLAHGVHEIGDRWPLVDETAYPGYYSAELGGTGIKAELTVGKKCAVHRYTFAASEGSAVAIDLSCGGLQVLEGNEAPSEASLELISDTQARGHIVCSGLPIYFHIQTDANAWHASAFSGREISAETSLPVGSGNPYGVVFTSKVQAGESVVVKIGFSLRSASKARKNLETTGAGGFDAVAEEARDEWDDYLRCIRVEGGSADQQKLFYTALYHSLIKPADFTGENPRSENDKPFFLDIATMWDVYKTLVPLMTLLYPQRAGDFVNSLLDMAEANGGFPIAVLMHKELLDREHSQQAGYLAHVIIADAYTKGISGIDWARALRLMVADLANGRGAEYVKTGKGEFPTHVLDFVYGAFCTAQIAAGLNNQSTYEEMMRLSEHWRGVYDSQTGLLIPGTYYEGDIWNYSFRLLHDMAGRIVLGGGDQAFVDKLDTLCGLNERPNDPYFFSWEALNNESDMESPYSYIYAGRHDRTAEIVRATLKYRFDTNRGGIPGNDDNGGTSAWYVWSAIGIFPAAGQSIFLIGSPTFDKVSIDIDGSTFTVEAIDASDENIYVQEASLNGKPLNRAYLQFSEMANGGRLVVKMGPRPSDWANDTRPPSYSIF